MSDAFASTHYTSTLTVSGSAAADDALLFTVTEASLYDGFMLMSSAGAVDVEITLDGQNWSSAPLSLQDFGATTLEPVLATIAGRVYGFAGRFRGVRVRQNGATPAEAQMIAWKM